MYDSGIKPTVANASLERAKYVIDECKNAKMAAKDIILLRLNENLQHLSEERAELEKQWQMLCCLKPIAKRLRPMVSRVAQNLI